MYVSVLFQHVLNMMGVKTWLQWSAIFAEYLIWASVTTVISVFILLHPVKMNDVEVDGVSAVAPYYRAPVENVDTYVMCAFLFVCLLPILASNFLVSAFFSKGMHVLLFI